MSSLAGIRTHRSEMDCYVREFLACRDILLFTYENMKDDKDPRDADIRMLASTRAQFEDSYRNLSTSPQLRPVFLSHDIERRYRNTQKVVEQYERNLFKKSSNALNDSLDPKAVHLRVFQRAFPRHSDSRAPSDPDDPLVLRQSKTERHQCKYARPVKPCTLCSECHRLWHCPVFRDMSVFERLDHVNRHKLCHNCFLNTHTTDKCGKNAICYVRGCDEKHSMWIHIDPSSDSDNSENIRLFTDQSILASESITERESLSQTLVSHADCYTSLSQSTVCLDEMSSLSHIHTHEEKATQYTVDEIMKSPFIRDSYTVDKCISSVDLEGVVKLIDVLKESLISFTELVEKCIRIIPERFMSDDIACLSSHFGNKSRSVCVEDVSTMTNTFDSHMFTNRTIVDTDAVLYLSHLCFETCSNVRLICCSQKC